MNDDRCGDRAKAAGKCQLSRFTQKSVFLVTARPVARVASAPSPAIEYHFTIYGNRDNYFFRTWLGSRACSAMALPRTQLIRRRQQ